MRGSRQPTAGPSARRTAAGKTRRNPAPVPNNSIIDLSDSEDEELARQRLKKRRRLDHGVIDLTEPKAGPSRPMRLAAPAAQREGIDPSAATKDMAVNLPQRQERPFPDFSGRLQAVGESRAAPIAVDAEEVGANMEDFYLSHVLEVVPDVQPGYALELVRKHIPDYGSEVANNVVHMLFEDSSYPKIEQNKGKRKREADDAGPPPKIVKTVDYGSTDRTFVGGPYYFQMAVDQLSLDFPRIPKPYVRQILSLHNNFYAPAYLRLREDMKLPLPPYKVKATASRVQSKMKYHDVEFKLEREWLLQKLQSEATQSEAGPSSNQAVEDDGECEDGIECGCCFSTYSFDRMVQCPEAHLFCVSCMTSYVSDRLGQHDPQIKCMDQSGCKLLFSDTELKRFLTEKLWALYERVKQTKEIEAAGLEGLEDCPFCDFKLVIENDEEKLFRCQNEECGVVSCRACKKVDHLPKSCKEADEEKGLDARHKVEEAMTEAIMRKCPNCRKPFVKELGCNKMTCPHCHTLSCYVCRKVIKGYDHFDQTPAGHRTRESSNKCALWDKVEERHEQEAAAARQRAIEQVQIENPDLDKNELDVELPKAAPAPAAGPPAPDIQRLRHRVEALQQVNFRAEEMHQHVMRQQMQMRQQLAAIPRQAPQAPLRQPARRQAQPVVHHHPPEPIHRMNVVQMHAAQVPQVANPLARPLQIAAQEIPYQGNQRMVAGPVRAQMIHQQQEAAVAAHKERVRVLQQQHEVAFAAQMREMQRQQEAVVAAQMEQQRQHHHQQVMNENLRLRMLAQRSQQQPVMGPAAQAVPGWGRPPNAQLRHHP